MEMTPPAAAAAEGNGTKEIRRASFGPSGGLGHSRSHSRRGFSRVDSFVNETNSISVKPGHYYERVSAGALDEVPFITS
jgi:hypothetical protein